VILNLAVFSSRTMPQTGSLNIMLALTSWKILLSAYYG
jgi:hypothetical protein